MCKVNTVSDAVELGCSKAKNARTGFGTTNNTDGPKRPKNKIDITTPNKTNKTPILVSY